MDSAGAGDVLVDAFRRALIAANPAPLDGLLTDDVGLLAARSGPQWASQRSGREAVAEFVTEAPGTVGLEVTSATVADDRAVYELVERIERGSTRLSLRLAMVLDFDRSGRARRVAFYSGPRGEEGGAPEHAAA